MRQFDRRRFLQSTSLLIAGGYARAAFGDEAVEAPAFAKEPSYDPRALFLTWQRDPTTTMTVQWLGAEKDAVERPIWFAKHGTNAWHKKPAAARPFPMTDHSILRAELAGLEPDTEYVFRVEGRERFHVALSETGRVVDVCSTTKHARIKSG